MLLTQTIALFPCILSYPSVNPTRWCAVVPIRLFVFVLDHVHNNYSVHYSSFLHFQYLSLIVGVSHSTNHSSERVLRKSHEKDLIFGWMVLIIL